MKILLIGIVIIMAGGLSFLEAIYLSWSAGNPGMTTAYIAKHKMLSSIFVWLSYLLFVFGCATIYWSIRKMNKTHKEESTKATQPIA